MKRWCRHSLRQACSSRIDYRLEHTKNADLIAGDKDVRTGYEDSPDLLMGQLVLLYMQDLDQL